jgi:hypothetical protein
MSLKAARCCRCRALKRLDLRTSPCFCLWDFQYRITALLLIFGACLSVEVQFDRKCAASWNAGEFQSTTSRASRRLSAADAVQALDPGRALWQQEESTRLVTELHGATFASV